MILKKNKNSLETVIISIVILIGTVVFSYWFFHNPVKNLTVNVPGMDQRPLKNAGSREAITIGEKFKEYTTYTSTLTGKWPRFRGADIDNINKEKIKLIDSWAGGPKILWKVELGDGHAGAAVYNGKVFIIDYDERKKADALRCFSLETGTEIWRRWYGVSLKRNHGISRTVPAVTDKYVVSMGPSCHVMCTDPNNGNLLWGIDLSKNYNTEVPLWYTGQCPLIDNDIAVIAPAGDVLMIGVDCATGKVAWQTPNPDHWKMSHSSIIPMIFQGTKMYIYCAIGGIIGIAAEGANKGKVLWKTDAFKPSVFAPSPVILDKGRIFVTAGYGAGGALLQLTKAEDKFTIKVVQMYKPKDGMASEQQTPIFYKNHLFSIQPKDAGESRNQFVCCNPDDCKKILWTSSKSDRYGLGPFILADEKFFILNDDGTLTIAKASLSKFIFLDKAKIIDGQDAWAPLAIVDGRLLMRDSKQLVCIDVRAR